MRLSMSKEQRVQLFVAAALVGLLILVREPHSLRQSAERLCRGLGRSKTSSAIERPYRAGLGRHWHSLSGRPLGFHATRGRSETVRSSDYRNRNQ